MPSGVSSARHFVTGGAALSRTDAKDGDGQAERQHPCCHTACRSVACLWVAALPPLFVPVHFCPQMPVGGKNGRFALSGSGFAAWLASPSRPRRGCGESKGERFAGLGKRSHWSLDRPGPRLSDDGANASHFPPFSSQAWGWPFGNAFSSDDGIGGRPNPVFSFHPASQQACMKSFWPAVLPAFGQTTLPVCILSVRVSDLLSFLLAFIPARLVESHL
jgi:hypothetical protein